MMLQNYGVKKLSLLSPLLTSISLFQFFSLLLNSLLLILFSLLPHPLFVPRSTNSKLIVRHCGEPWSL